MREDISAVGHWQSKVGGEYAAGVWADGHVPTQLQLAQWLSANTSKVGKHRPLPGPVKASVRAS